MPLSIHNNIYTVIMTYFFKRQLSIIRTEKLLGVSQGPLTKPALFVYCWQLMLNTLTTMKMQFIKQPLIFGKHDCRRNNNATRKQATKEK